MLKKLRLDQTKKYERCLAIEVISEMLLAFINGRPYYLAIGAEQGNIDKWDDFVINKNDGGNIYIQVKRQTTHFSTDSIIRDRYKQGKRKGEFRDLSPLDETLKSLGKRISANLTSSNDLKDEFWIELPESSTMIKEGLEIRDFRNICEVNIKNVTTLEDLSKLASIDQTTSNIYDWLTTWCDFKDWEHILKALKILKTITAGLEVDIKKRSTNNLRQVFRESDIENAYSLISDYLDENETYAGAIKPRQLLNKLRNYILPEICRWTSFQTNGSTWSISGIHDMKDINRIESPSVIVPALWSKVNVNARLLKIDGICQENCLVSESLMRLSLHPQGSFDIICSDKSSWENSIRIKIGGTIGVAKNDLNDLRLLDGLERSSHSESLELNTIDKKEDFAKELQNEMYKLTFKLVDTAILNKLQGMERSDLRSEVEKRWITWKQLLENNFEEQKKLFSKILHPNAEGKSILGELRVGPKTAYLLCESIFLLLIVSVCLGDEDNQNWISVKNKLKMNSVGLAYWSGPADGSRKVIEIDDDAGIGKLLENEQGQIIIIPQSKLTEADAFKDDICGDITKLGLLTHPSYPKLLITNERKFNRELAKGDVAKLRSYFQSILDKYENIIENEVKKVVDEVVV